LSDQVDNATEVSSAVIRTLRGARALFDGALALARRSSLSAGKLMVFAHLSRACPLKLERYLPRICQIL
jgi:hypothetical protein